MNFLERINQNREDKMLRKVRSGNIDERALVKVFKSSNNKVHFISQCNSALHFQLPERLTNAILEFAKSDTNFLLAICPIMFNNRELQN